jgi:hypothetical protein
VVAGMSSQQMLPCNIHPLITFLLLPVPVLGTIVPETGTIRLNHGYDNG